MMSLRVTLRERKSSDWIRKKVQKSDLKSVCRCLHFIFLSTVTHYNINNFLSSHTETPRRCDSFHAPRRVLQSCFAPMSPVLKDVRRFMLRERRLCRWVSHTPERCSSLFIFCWPHKTSHKSLNGAAVNRNRWERRDQYADISIKWSLSNRFFLTASSRSLALVCVGGVSLWTHIIKQRQ